LEMMLLLCSNRPYQLNMLVCCVSQSIKHMPPFLSYTPLLEPSLSVQGWQAEHVQKMWHRWQRAKALQP
jgi:hypothetical protein